MDSINVWSPISILPADIIPEPSLNVAHTKIIDIEYDPDIIGFDELCNYINKGFDCSAVSFKEPKPDKASDAVRFHYCEKFITNILEEKNMNKGKVGSRLMYANTTSARNALKFVGMKMIKLYDYQKDAVDRLKTGSILCGGVGSGKSLTSLAYYHKVCGGRLDPFSRMTHPKDLYVITTAHKRDTGEWESDACKLLIFKQDDVKVYNNEFIVDSWNNIKKYSEVSGAFFIFDEQRVVGSGAWVKAFLKIAKHNDWILLSATPGDTWMDYVPVFIANGFYKNKTEFVRRHCVFSRFSKYPKIERYMEEGRLLRFKRQILVEMDFIRPAKSLKERINCEYDHELYKKIMKDRWNIFKDEPIINASELCFCLRKVVNSDESRANELIDIWRKKHKVIVFYNFIYELDILRGICETQGITYAEWNGEKHEPVPRSNSWMYLVQYTAGAEGWNCINTDTVVFYSLNYSYKVMTQAAGRIDRLNTPYKNLYYYEFRSASGIDQAISRALSQKKKFNESSFVR